MAKSGVFWFGPKRGSGSSKFPQNAVFVFRIPANPRVKKIGILSRKEVQENINGIIYFNKNVIFCSKQHLGLAGSFSDAMGQK